MWIAIGEFLAKNWKYGMAVLAGIMLFYPVHVLLVDHYEKQILELQKNIETARAEGNEVALKARTDADTERSAALASMQKTYDGILSSIIQINQQIAPALQALDTSFKELRNDPSYACLYKPLPNTIIDRLRSTEATDTSTGH